MKKTSLLPDLKICACGACVSLTSDVLFCATRGMNDWVWCCVTENCYQCNEMTVPCFCSWRKLKRESLGLNQSALNLQLSVCVAAVVLATEAVAWLPSHVVSGNRCSRPYWNSLYHDQLSGMTHPSSNGCTPRNAPADTSLNAPRYTCMFSMCPTLSKQDITEPCLTLSKNSKPKKKFHLFKKKIVSDYVHKNVTFS